MSNLGAAQAYVLLCMALLSLRFLLKSDISFTLARSARLLLRQQLHDQCEDVTIIRTEYIFAIDNGFD